ncbi:MAG: isoquinoline 1-oxidoreductase subunit beta [Candidatus Eremiobacteraeota bacterium]|jgi:isoquinoline 1-oxidoreductase beta subunit|nr:isoquinoline 1-oxidoreductase subunit beta [Candidatus Eremiobacteraeota bacterium]
MKRGEFLLGLASSGALIAASGAAGPAAGEFAPSPWIALEPDGAVVLTLHRAEMGQGVHTALAMLVAEELDVDLARVRVAAAPAHPKYGDQDTSGSETISANATALRTAGATARAALVGAAAARWSVAPDACTTAGGVVRHAASGRALRYTELLADAARFAPSGGVALKPKARWNLIGRPHLRLDSRDKVTGRARFGLDVRLPGMVYASLERAPRLGAELRSCDAAAARAARGVVDVVVLDRPALAGDPLFVPAVAVVATSYWAAVKARRLLELAWSGGPHAGADSGAIFAALESAARAPAPVVLAHGDADAALRAAKRVVSATYRSPLQAHATLEPQNATADVRADGCDVWVPTQNPLAVQEAARAVTGLPDARIVTHQTLLGGGFGRRADRDFALEALVLSQRLGRPVKVVWSREDDFAHDVYRPANVNHVVAAIDGRGELAAVVHRQAGVSIRAQRGSLPLGAPDRLALRGATKTPYAFAAYRVEHHNGPLMPVRLGWWRGVGFSQNTFAVESSLDEIAHAMGRDPYALRRELVRDDAVARNVLDRVAKLSGWGGTLPARHGRGLALVAFDDGTVLAHVAEVAVGEGGAIEVLRIVTSVDCGQVVNPMTVEAQVQGGIAFGLGAALRHEITIANGQVVERNFDRYPLPRMSDMPAIVVDVVESDRPPCGIGEPAVPPLAPALANAVFAATGKRLRTLPLRFTG